MRPGCVGEVSVDPVLFGSLRDRHLFFLAPAYDVRLPCMRETLCFLSPMTPWYRTCDRGVSIVRPGPPRGETLCSARLVQALCACSGSYSLSQRLSRPAPLGNRNRCAPPWCM